MFSLDSGEGSCSLKEGDADQLDRLSSSILFQINSVGILAFKPKYIFDNVLDSGGA